MTPEAKVKESGTHTERSRCVLFLPSNGGFGRSGVPDVVACYKGRFIAS